MQCLVAKKKKNKQKHSYSKDYFVSQLEEFKNLMAKKSFWCDLDKAGIALKALFFIYTRIPTEDFDKQTHRAMILTIVQYIKKMTKVIHGENL